jgi:hypothetical protein
MTKDLTKIFEISQACYPEPCPDENQDRFKISPFGQNEMLNQA